MCPDTLEPARQDDIRRGLSSALHVGARPLTVSAWREVLEGAGFVIEHEFTAPMALLHPRRVIEDEGVLRALKILTRVVCDPPVRARVRTIRATFARHGEHLSAISLVATKPT